MTGILFIRDLAVVLVTAGAVAWLCQRLKLSVVVGYLTAGAIIGPYTPPFAFVTDLDRVQTLAQLGLVFLIFGIGLNLSISRLKRLGLSVLVATALSAFLVLNACHALGAMLGWNKSHTLFIAGMLMVSSSAIISKVLDELNQTHERPGQLALGMTVLEDVVAVVMLTLLSSLVQFGGGQSTGILSTLGLLGAFVVFIALLSLLVMPKLLSSLSRHAQPEIRTLVVAGLLLFLAWTAVKAGYSLALGAFVLGAIVGSTRFKGDIERTFAGVRDIFGAVFFVAVGMLVDFRMLREAWPLLLLVTALALLLRPLACAAGFLAVGNTSRDSFQAGLALVPLGEFSFIIAQLGVEAGALPKQFYPVAVGASLLTSLLAPMITRRAESWSEVITAAHPRFVRTSITFYHDLLSRLLGKQSASLLWRLSRKRLAQIGIHILFLSALIVLANPLYLMAERHLTRDLLFANGLAVLFWTAFGFVLLAPLIAIWRNISAVAMIVAEGAAPGESRLRLRSLLEFALRLLAFLALATWLLALLPDGNSFLGIGGLILLLLVIAGLIFRRRFIRLHSRFEIELMEQFKLASHSAATSAWSSSLPDNYRDWDVEIDEVVVPSDSVHAGKTVGRLALRQQFGCSIIGVDRNGFGVLNPKADFALFPQDKLLLVGRRTDLENAARHLGASNPDAGTSGFGELTMETVAVPAASPLAGRTLIELDLIGKIGVQVVGIHRDKTRIIAPSGKDQLQENDELLTLGTHEQITTLQQMLAAPECQST